MQHQLASVLFQSTLPHGSDKIRLIIKIFLLGFQSTLPHGSDLWPVQGQAGGLISIHAPSRERLFCLASCQWHDKFQSTLPHGSDQHAARCGKRWRHFNPRSLTGATYALNTVIHNHYYFNPRSLTGATLGNALIALLVKISIHAPSRERHYVNDNIVQFTKISIHAPSRERPNSPIIISVDLRFQSTLPHGSDMNMQHLRKML